MGITIAGGLLRLVGIGDQSLWVDEAVSLWLAELAAGDTLSLLTEATNNPHPPLYFLILKAWAAQAGSSIESARLLSCALSTASIPLAHEVVRLVAGGRAAALLAASLVAVSPIQIWYAQEARMYALLGFLTLVSTVALLTTIRHRATLPRLAIHGLSLTMAAYTHTAGLFLIAAHVLIIGTRVLLGFHESGRLLGSTATATAAWLPWLPVLTEKVSGGAVPWISSPTTDDLRMLALIFGSGLMPHVLWEGRSPLEPLAAVVSVGVLLLVGVAVILKGSSRLWPLVVLAFGPLVLQIDASLLQPILLDRTLVGSGLLLVVLAAIGAVAPRRRLFRALAFLPVIGFLTVSALTLAQTYGVAIKERWDVAAASVGGRVQDGDAILFQGNSSQLAFKYYYDRLTTTPQNVAMYGIPCSLSRSCTRIEEPPTKDDRARLAAAIQGSRRVWMVRRWYGNWDFYLDDAVSDATAATYTLHNEHDVGGVVILRYEQSHP